MSKINNSLPHELVEWRERVEAIAPVLRAHSAESIELRTLAPASVAALEEIEAFKLSGPREVGGLNAHPTTQLEAFVELTRADVSAGWCTMVQSMVAGLAGGVDGADGVVVFPTGGNAGVGVGKGGGIDFGQRLPGGQGIPPDSQLVTDCAGFGLPAQQDRVVHGLGGQRRGGKGGRDLYSRRRGGWCWRWRWRRRG